MATFTFPMPDIGEGITEAEIVAWHKQVGDRVSEDEEFVDMMTDKATVPLESPVTGTIVQIAGEVGDMVAIGSPLIVVEVEGEAADETAEAAELPSPAAEVVAERIEVENPDAIDVEDARRADPVPAAIPVPTPAPAPTPTPASAGAKVLASPAVRARAKDLGVDLAQVRGDGRVRHADLDSFIAYSGGYSGAGQARADESIKVIGLRKRIAENMAASKRQIPHFTYVEECDVTALEDTRAQLNQDRGDRPKLTMLPLLITAICKALPGFPMINARYDDEAKVVTRHGAVHLGMATMTDNGLMVPVIRDAQAKNLWQLATEIGRLAEAARSGSAKSEELSGSSLTVTSLGPLGGIATTPVINRPEVAIIGPNRIVERPMFVTGADGVERIEKRKLMNVSISCDHRVVDGYDAAAFVQEVKKLIEAPARILAG
ncbi:2-oxo acid dehydrogenase subunit E2 [Erythrobacter arachoides]|uniref:Dihydrolipoamide acetyltransferase component of pyruvate dehydrogenase complex n=1 Tax=Aurantiacibacter arachoides TaxID=1850444 RepID=A0A844ZZN9_9SPHN|nr:dihydrolipoamide acetyltransferase family protein [Aurantiacibacter arachoides]MXO93365.1 2-oxo acid dehydrogenase subunit E2 [Aurantiacibacter arachoides]GGD49941.1 dihydrolipoamide acetyltransferase component of pyruvate dehydrogenase complex [Aurantiacibacter arachoides]